MAFPTSQILADDNLFWSLDSQISFAKNGPFFDGPNTRWQVFADWVNLNIVVARTTDNGLTWTRFTGPSIPQDSGGPNPRQFQTFAACYDSTNRIIYIYHWTTGFTLAITPFDIASTSFGSTADSGAGFPVTSPMVDPALACEYRPSDNSVWGLFTCNDGGATDAEKVYGAKYDCSGASWGSQAIRFGSAGDTMNYRLGAMALDPATNKIHITGTIDPRNVSPLVSASLWHATIDTSDGFSSPDTIASGTTSLSTTFDRLGNLNVTASGVIGFTFMQGGSRGVGTGSVMYVARAAVADVPAWEIASPGPMQLSAEAGTMIFPQMAFAEYLGAQYVIYGYLVPPSGVVTNFAYISSAGLGEPWDSVETLIGLVDSSGGLTFAGADVVAVFGNYGIVLNLAYTADGNAGGLYGVGYYELVPAPPVARRVRFRPWRTHVSPGN